MANEPIGKGIDLVAAAEAMPPELNKLARKIIRLRDAKSSHADLAMAFDMLSTIRDIQPAAESGKHWTARCIPALTYSAIILYARATKSNSKHRGTLDLRSRLSADEIEAHDKICRLRDDAIAHFGPGGQAFGPSWHQEGVFVPLDRPDDARIVTFSRRVILDPQSLRQIAQQVHRTMILVERITRERDEEVVDELNAAIEAQPGLVDFLKAYHVDFEEYFGGPEEAELILAGDRVGSLREVIFRG